MEQEIGIYFFYAVIAACGMGILCKLISSFICRKLLRETDNISGTKNRMLKQLKLKFENCYKLNLGVNNVNIFVDKYLFHHRICGLTVHQWSRAIIFWMLFCVLAGTTGGIYFLYQEQSIEKMLLMFLTGLCGAILLIIFDSMGAMDARIEMMTVNLQDYLENNLSARLEQTIEKEEKAEEKKISFQMKEELEQMKDSLMRMEHIFAGNQGRSQQKLRLKNETSSSDKEQIIEDVIQEFLT